MGKGLFDVILVTNDFIWYKLQVVGRGKRTNHAGSILLNKYVLVVYVYTGVCNSNILLLRSIIHYHINKIQKILYDFGALI